MKRRFLASLLCVVLILGSTLVATAEEVASEETIIEDYVVEEIADGEATPEDVVTEDISTEEIIAENTTAEKNVTEVIVVSEDEIVSGDILYMGTEDGVSTAGGGEGYFDISDQLFYNGAISPDYDIKSYDEISDYELVGAGQNRARELAIYLYNKLVDYPYEIDVSEFADYLTAATYKESSGILQKALIAACNEHSELFTVTGGFNYSYRTVSGGAYVVSLRPKYSTAYHDMVLLEERIEEALSVVKDDMTDEQKAIALHDYIVLNCEYDKERLDNKTLDQHPDTYNMYGVLVDNIAVCQGYAETYKYLLNRVGITAYLVTSDNQNHAWNIVELDGKLYQVDTTWDDPTWDKLGRVYHRYMFCSDDDDKFYTAHMKNTEVKDWVVYKDYEATSIVATGTKYNDAYWRTVYTSLVMHGDDYYYLIVYSNAIAIAKISAVFNSSNSREVITYVYDDFDWSNVYDIDGTLYFNTSTEIRSFDYVSKAIETVYTAPSGKISGSAYLHGNVYYATDYPDKARQTIVKANLSFTNNERMVVYASNDGKNITIPVTYKGSATENLAGEVFQRTGFTFVGWNTKADGSGTFYAAGESVRNLPISASGTKLYAQWKLANNTVQYMGSWLWYNGSITLGHELYVAEELLEDKGSYALMDNGDKIYLNDLSSSEDGEFSYLMLFTDFAVKDIGKTVEIRFFKSNGDQFVVVDEEGNELGVDILCADASIYLRTIAENKEGIYDKKSVAAASGLLLYGECADAYFNDSDAISDARLDSVTAESMYTYKSSITGTTPGLDYIGSTLILETNTIIRHYFMLMEGYSISDYEFEIEEGYCVSLKETALQGICYIEISNIEYCDFATVYSLRTTTGGNLSMTYGMYSYAYDVLVNGENENLCNLVKAMYLFGNGTEK